MTLARRILIVAGAAVIALGAVVLASDQTVPQMIGVAAWLLAAIILHDGILAPLVFGVDLLLRRSGRRLRPAYLVVIQVAVVVGAVLTLVVAPEIRATTIGNPNPTVVPFDYALRLGGVWLALAAASIAVCVGMAVARRRLQRGGRDD
jgi:hypothetical protein